jgi:hypothetical protein
MTAPQALEIFRQNVADRAVYFADGDFPANGCRQIFFANQQLRNLHFPATPPSAKQIADGRKSLFSFDFFPLHIPATTPSYYVGEGTSAPLLHVGSSPPPCRWLVDAKHLSCRLIDPLTT